MSSRIVLVSVWLCCLACAETQAKPTERPAIPAPALLAPSALNHDFQWRQHVSATWPTGTHSFDAVLQKHAGELTLVGMSPLGLPGFVFRLDKAGELHVDNRTGEKLLFDPAYVVADVERVFFPWLVPPPPGFSGKRGGQHGGFFIMERWEHGHLRERRFTRDTPAGKELVVVSYVPGPQKNEHEAPLQAALQNQLLGYSLTIETVEQTQL